MDSISKIGAFNGTVTGHKCSFENRAPCVGSVSKWPEKDRAALASEVDSEAWAVPGLC